MSIVSLNKAKGFGPSAKGVDLMWGGERWFAHCGTTAVGTSCQ